MLVKQPRLLWCADLSTRIDRVIGQLLRIHPSKDRDVVADIIAEYPELLYRMVRHRDFLREKFHGMDIKRLRQSLISRRPSRSHEACLCQ